MLAKCSGVYLYLYLNQNQSGQLFQNCVMNPLCQSNWFPVTFRFIHTVAQDSASLSISSYNTQSYPLSTRNAIMTVRKL